MTLPLPTDVGHAFIRVALTGDNEPMEFGWHFDSTSYVGDAAAMASSIRVAWSASFVAGDMSTSYTFLGCRVEVNDTGGPPYSVGASDVAVAGSFANSPLPQNVAFLLHKRTTAAGRSNQGRCYMPPAYAISEADVTATGGIAGASVTAVNTRLSTVRTALATANLPMLVLGLTNNGVPVTSFTLDPVVATRRRRLRR